MAEFKVTVDSEVYKGATAPAVDQFHALHIACNSKLIVGMQEGLNEKTAVLHLMQVSWPDLNTLSKLLIDGKLTRESDGAEVAANLFRDKPEQWGLLLLKVARANLEGFYTLRSDHANDASAAKQTSGPSNTTPTV